MITIKIGLIRKTYPTINKIFLKDGFIFLDIFIEISYVCLYRHLSVIDCTVRKGSYVLDLIVMGRTIHKIKGK